MINELRSSAAKVFFAFFCGLSVLLLSATFASAGTIETTSDGYVKFTDRGGEKTDALRIYQDTSEAIMFESWRTKGDPVDTTAGDCELTASRTEKYSITYDIDTYSCQVDSSTLGVVALMGDESDTVFLGNPSKDSFDHDEKFALSGNQCASSAPENAKCFDLGSTTPRFPVHVDLGIGDDLAQIVDQNSNDLVVCGDGNDEIYADRMDIADPTCEKVLMYTLEVLSSGGRCKDNEQAVQYFHVLGKPGFVVESGETEMYADFCRDSFDWNYDLAVSTMIYRKQKVSNTGVFKVRIGCSLAAGTQASQSKGSCSVSPDGDAKLGSKGFFKGANRKLFKSLRGKSIARPLFGEVTIPAGSYVDVKFRFTNYKIVRHLRSQSKAKRYVLLKTGFKWYNSENPTVSGSEKSEFLFTKKASKSGKKK